MKIKTNYHSHNTFCDGKSTMEEMVLSAIERRFTHFGISSHAPVPDDDPFALANSDVQAYKDEFYRLKDKYSNKIKLFLSLEMDYITDIVEDLEYKAHDVYKLDYFIGSVHQVKEHNNEKETWFIDGSKQESYDYGLREVFKQDIKRGVTCFYNQQIEMIETNHPDILGHCDKIVMHNKDRYFKEDENWYKELVYNLFDVVIKYNTIVEVNTRGIYKKRNDDFYPSTFWLRYLIEKNVPLTISTDCHKAEETDGYYKETLDCLKELHCKELYYFDGEWRAEKIDNFFA